jgi:hypothetical protein
LSLDLPGRHVLLPGRSFNDSAIVLPFVPAYLEPSNTSSGFKRPRFQHLIASTWTVPPTCVLADAKSLVRPIDAASTILFDDDANPGRSLRCRMMSFLC